MINYQIECLEKIKSHGHYRESAIFMVINLYYSNIVTFYKTMFNFYLPFHCHHHSLILILLFCYCISISLPVLLYSIIFIIITQYSSFIISLKEIRKAKAKSSHLAQPLKHFQFISESFICFRLHYHHLLLFPYIFQRKETSFPISHQYESLPKIRKQEPSTEFLQPTPRTLIVRSVEPARP